MFPLHEGLSLRSFASGCVPDVLRPENFVDSYRYRLKAHIVLHAVPLNSHTDRLSASFPIRYLVQLTAKSVQKQKE
jgi:hypothetical protein